MNEVRKTTCFAYRIDSTSHFSCDQPRACILAHKAIGILCKVIATVSYFSTLTKQRHFVEVKASALLLIGADPPETCEINFRIHSKPRTQKNRNSQKREGKITNLQDLGTNTPRGFNKFIFPCLACPDLWRVACLIWKDWNTISEKVKQMSVAHNGTCYCGLVKFRVEVLTFCQQQRCFLMLLYCLWVFLCNNLHNLSYCCQGQIVYNGLCHCRGCVKQRGCDPVHGIGVSLDPVGAFQVMPFESIQCAFCVLLFSVFSRYYKALRARPLIPVKTT